MGLTILYTGVRKRANVQSVIALDQWSGMYMYMYMYIIHVKGRGSPCKCMVLNILKMEAVF